MSRWFEEIRLGSHPLDEIGAAFYIREMLGNDCNVNMWDLREVFGSKCDAILENLVRSGCLATEICGCKISLRIIAPGDRKRERCKMLVGKKRKSRKVKHEKEN